MRAHETFDPADIAQMPRGGPGASWLNRLMQTDRLEYIDRDDVPEELKQKVIGVLERTGDRFGMHEQNARSVLDLVADIENPKILELGAGHGKLSAGILQLHPSAEVTVTDLDAASVRNIAASVVGGHPRAQVEVMDATSIDYPENSFDVVVFAASFHHLPPAAACLAIAEATRVGRKFLVIDGLRPPAGILALNPVMALPVMAVMLLFNPPSTVRAFCHDAYISSLRSYSRSAFAALAAAAGREIEFLPTRGKLSAMQGHIVFRKP